MTKTIAQLTEDTNPASTSLFEISVGGLSRKAALSNLHKNMTQGTTSQAGTLELATDAEAITGTSTALAMTPANVRAVLATAPDGTMFNLKINVVVTSNDLVVSLKTHAGTDPSATDPGFAKINGTVRTVTAATSMTLADATNWFNLGGAPHAAIENNLFAYAVWDSNSSIVAVSASRYPSGKLVSDFSATTTNEKYLGNQANFTSTDDVVNIGRFAATLSAAAGHVWTVPTFTSANLIQTPIFESEWISWLPAPTGYSAVPTNVSYRYKVIGKDCIMQFRETTNGTSNATTLTFTAPFTAASVTNGGWIAFGSAVNNGADLATPCLIALASASGTVSAFKDTAPGGTAWTNANGKRILGFEMRYPIM